MQVFISSSARDSRQAFIASFVLSRASSTVSHCETQPGNPEQLAIVPAYFFKDDFEAHDRTFLLFT
jgi:hypothetical protein